MPDFRADISEAAQTGDLSRLRELLEGNPAFASMPDSQGYTPLHYAAYFGQLEAARFLLGIGAEMSAVSMDPLRNHPLHAAASSGHGEVVQLLLEAGADPNAEQTGRWTPLHGAAAAGHLGIVRALLARGADTARQSVSGATPLALAEEKGHVEVVRVLREAAG
jgi:uncharacterized protein